MLVTSSSDPQLISIAIYIDCDIKVTGATGMNFGIILSGYFREEYSRGSLAGNSVSSLMAHPALSKSGVEFHVKNNGLLGFYSFCVPADGEALAFRRTIVATATRRVSDTGGYVKLKCWSVIFRNVIMTISFRCSDAACWLQDLMWKE
ncbi:MAG: hypothetical protein EAX81_00085 [Candidatus Thorarchaeota archaeon]|nr:hypothetical protein [Candidatus Thorarchaeota archaeon]